MTARKSMRRLVPIILACLGAVAGCAFREPLARSLGGTRAMRVDARASDVDLVNEGGGAFGVYLGGGGGCGT